MSVCPDGPRGMKSRRFPAGWPSAVLLTAVLLPPLVVRLLLMAEADLTPAPADGRGILTDLGTALFVAAALAALSRVPAAGKWVGAAIAGLWSLIHFANYEHIRELGSVVNPANARYLADETFLFGSVFAATHPVALIVVTVLAVVSATVAVGSGRSRGAWKQLVAAVVVTILSVLLPMAEDIASWRQTGPFTIHMPRLSEGGIPRELGPGVLAERDLDGPPRLAAGPRPRNVLLVILEGTSGAFLPSLRERHGARSSISMPGLDEIAQRGFAYSSFISTQRQTNRGEYAVLCGEYPKLTSAEARMSELAGVGPLPCLPRALLELGFATAYLQAAPLPFMFKDQFMPQAGFDRVHGNAWFEGAHHRNHWGVDDRTLFEGALELIAELEEGSQPWFLTLLTVGTHHRYSVPPDFRGRHEPGSQEWAFEYLDRAVTSFVSQLESLGVLDDTLVLITSDESQAMEVGGSDHLNVRLQAWGFLIALLPTREHAVVDEIFTQADVPISVLDLLDRDIGSYRFSGRSVFRRYKRPRPVFWGNTHLRMVAGLTATGLLTVCSEDLARCTTSKVEGGRLFHPELEARASTSKATGWLQSAVARSLESPAGELRRRVALIGPGTHPVLAASGEQYLFGGQFITVPRHSRIDVEIGAELHGTSGWIEFTHNFVVDRRPVLAWSERIQVGETLQLEYTVGTEHRLEDVESRMWVTSSDGVDLSLTFSSAALSVEVLGPSQPVPDTALHTLQISGRPADPSLRPGERNE